MKWNKLYKYPKSIRETLKGVRHYDVDDEKLPSVTTILQKTQTIEKTESLKRWAERVGETEAERIKNTAAKRGTAMHSYLEAYLHDVVEDTKYDLNDLRNQIALNVNEIQAIDLLTRQKDQTYFEYIAKIKDSKNELAIRVKLADIRDHLNLKETLKPSLEKRYRKAFKILTKNKLKGKEDYE